MSAVESLIKDIKNKKFLPIYFLAGEEPFFIDQVTEALEENVLTEEEKGFNQTILYGQDVDMNQIVGIAKQFPMGSDKSFVLVKEAQHLTRSIDDLDAYANQFQETTVLVFNYKGKKLDKRTKAYKTLNSKGFYHEFKPLYSNEIPTFIDQRINANQQAIDPKAKFLLAEYVGTDLSRLSNELDKLKTILGTGKTITIDDIESHIGISKEYNNFELRTAIEKRDIEKAFKIIKYFESNPKDNPMVVTMTIIFTLFTNIIQYHILTDKSKANVAKEIGINPFFVQDLAVAANNYPLKKATRIISLIREYDMKGKGVNSSGNVTSSELLIELIYKIIHF